MATADREPEQSVREESDRSSSTALPNARLNPLLNPLLAKQLGRWAHIYYTASVDKREAAVEKLVCELEAEAASLNPMPPTAKSQSAPVQRPVLVAPAQPVEQRVERSILAEPEAPPAPQAVTRQESEFARPSVTEYFAPRAEKINEQNLHAESPVAETEAHAHAESATAGPSHSRLDLPRRNEEDWSRTSGGGAAPHSFERDLTPAADYHSYGDLQASSAAGRVAPTSPRRWRAPVLAAGFVAVVIGSLWVVKDRHTQTLPAEQTHALPPAIQRPVAPPAGGSEASASSSSTLSPLLPPHPTALPAQNSTAKSPSATAALHPSSASPATQPADGAEETDAELALGLRYLRGTGVARNNEVAVHHLWLAVSKQNETALVTLAELYAQGEGVVKDCDQANILMGAASRQAKSHVQLQRLQIVRETLRTSGCE